MAVNRNARAVPLAYLRGTLTQGSADAFVQGSITTGLSGETNRCYRVRHLLFRLFAYEVDSAMEFSFTRKSVAAMPTLADKHCITHFVRNVSITTSGQYSVDSVVEKFFDDDEFLIVEDPLYAQLDSASTSGTNACQFALGYEEVSISADDRLELLVNSLGS